ncbi:hypothetical protein HBDW_40680 [Herbaspirillum sp. DW155]|uniref:AraC family transcriptional regulator n=1 Tax=Herbaspirillum sp. DW155 TaxID=3095609 RepID=UPI00308560C2|nr:hypothetical protein HBDW_40680 [Herbaspirillum sp. DW155]
MSDDRKKAYQARFERVLDHIEAHLHAPLEMEQLAAVAHFSRFHFQRQFADFTGVGVARYILLMRLKHASLQLAFQPQRRIIDIALEAGFENPESFTPLPQPAAGDPAWRVADRHLPAIETGARVAALPSVRNFPMPDAAAVL